MESYDQMKRRHTQEFIAFTDKDAVAQRALFDRHQQERQNAIAADKTGEGYIYQMFRRELIDREYNYTEDLDETLEALDLTIEEIDADIRFHHGLEKACKSLTDCF